MDLLVGLHVFDGINGIVVTRMCFQRLLETGQCFCLVPCRYSAQPGQG